MSQQMPTSRLLRLPSEVIQNVFIHCTTPSFIHLIFLCQKLYQIAAKSRQALLHHLQQIPGIKLGLDEHTVETSELFLLLRQRALSHLYGLNFTADCTDYRFEDEVFDAGASCFASSTLFMNLFISVRDSLRLRIYGGPRAFQEEIESPYADGRGQIIQVFQQRSTISVLYAWTSEPKEDAEAITSETPNFAISTKDALAGERHSSSQPLENVGGVSRTKYHLLHYNAFETDRPIFFNIPAPESVVPLVPIQISVFGRLQCAILWDRPGSRYTATIRSKILLYTCERLPQHEEGAYQERVLFPPPLDNKQSQEELPKKTYIGVKPRSIAFFRDGRRIKVYSSGSVVPSAVLWTWSAHSPHSLPMEITNEIRIGSHWWKIDTRFYGHHETRTEPETDTECIFTYLSLGTTTLPGGGPEVLGIIQSRKRLDYDDCKHTINLDGMSDDDDDESVLVARLWGWQQCSSSLTGLETVCISKKATRIAIALWNKILVWSLNPKVLCEELDQDVFDEDDKKGKSSRYYDLIRDVQLGGPLVVLKPIVLELGDSIVRKMKWTIKEDKNESGSDSESGYETDESKGKGPDLDDTSSLTEKPEVPEPDFESLRKPLTMDEVFETASEDIGALPDRTSKQPLKAPANTELAEKLAPPRNVFSSSASDAGSQSPRSLLMAPVVLSRTSSSSRIKRKRLRRVRSSEDELMVMTDRGLQVWNLGVRSSGVRELANFDTPWLER